METGWKGKEGKWEGRGEGKEERGEGSIKGDLPLPVEGL